MVVNVSLNERWTLTSDSRQWILSLDGRAEHFYTTIESALSSWIDMKMRTSNCRTISGLLQRQKQLTAQLNSVLEPLHMTIQPLKKEDENGKNKS